MYLFKVHQRLSTAKETNHYDWRALLGIAVVLAVVSNWEKGQDFEYS